MFQTHPMRTLLITLAALLVLAAVAYALRLNFPAFPQSAAPAPAGFPADAPAPRPQDYVEAQKGFQYLVMYTGGSFIPRALNVMRGETVRFTNNSDSTLNLSLSGAAVASLGHGEYYEYTFATADTFTYSDNTNQNTLPFHYF